MNLYLARHGETSWNKKGLTQGIQDVELNAKGRSQATKLGKRLSRWDSIDAIYCSDLMRARVTAEIIGEKLDIKPRALPLLREVNFGVWEGLSIDEIELLYPGELQRWRSEPEFAPKYGESLTDVWARNRSFITKLKEGRVGEDENILVISHGATIKVLILGALGLPLSSLLSLKTTQTGLSLLRLTEKEHTLVFLNDICHLRDSESGLA